MGRYGKPINPKRKFNRKTYDVISLSKDKTSMKKSQKYYRDVKNHWHTRLIKRKVGVAGTVYVLYGRRH